MALKTHTWISLWFLLTAPVIAWDVGYCFMRPRSMKGGDLHWIWSPYALYQEACLFCKKLGCMRVYGLPSLERGDGFTNAQSLLNVIETLLNLTYLYLAHISKWPPATIVGFASVEYYCGFCAVGHNNAWDLFTLWIIPNGLWIVVPTLIVIQFGKDLTQTLNFASEQAAKVASSKKQ
ncbi:hypothetical protein BJ912DRAFT_1022967 [Pholiota molesta]|nr:hypothetical protein BJ912DRAFT_1022967 [Pholiota molesta]